MRISVLFFLYVFFFIADLKNPKGIRIGGRGDRDGRQNK